MSDQSQRSQRWMKWVLMVSLALNLMVLGIVGGAFFKGGPGGPQARFDLTAGPLARALDDDTRGALRDRLRESGAFGPPNRAAMREDTLRMLEIVRAETFDAEAFRDVLSRQQDRLMSGQSTAFDAVTEQLSAMTLAQREAFADRVQSQMRRGAGPRSDRNEGGSGG